MSVDWANTELNVDVRGQCSTSPFIEWKYNSTNNCKHNPKLPFLRHQDDINVHAPTEKRAKKSIHISRGTDLVSGTIQNTTVPQSPVSSRVLLHVVTDIRR